VFEEREANGIILVFIIIEYFIFVAVNGGSDHKFYLMLEIYEIGIVQ
jgi:hypothetical protein